MGRVLRRLAAILLRPPAALWRRLTVWLARLSSRLPGWLVAGFRVSGMMLSRRNPNRVFITPGQEGETIAPDLGGDLLLDRETRDYVALARLLADLKDDDLARLPELVRRLAEAWVKEEEQMVPRERHVQVDLRRTLRVNLPRYGGHVFNLYWEFRPRAERISVEPARLLVIGDVSNSMTRYVSVLLYFFHSLGRHFRVDSWVFSERPTHATPWMEAGLTYEDKVRSLVAHARSWDSLTVLGSSLEEILKEAEIDRDTYVILATDGQVRIRDGEYPRIVRAMDTIRDRAREVHILTPTPEFAEKGKEYAVAFEQLTAVPLGMIHVNPPPFEMKVTWYGTLAAHADRVRLVRSGNDLVEYCRDVLRDANPRRPVHQ